MITPAEELFSEARDRVAKILFDRFGPIGQMNLTVSPEHKEVADEVLASLFVDGFLSKTPLR